MSGARCHRAPTHQRDLRDRHRHRKERRPTLTLPTGWPGVVARFEALIAAPSRRRRVIPGPCVSARSSRSGAALTCAYSLRDPFEAIHVRRFEQKSAEPLPCCSMSRRPCSFAGGRARCGSLRNSLRHCRSRAAHGRYLLAYCSCQCRAAARAGDAPRASEAEMTANLRSFAPKDRIRARSRPPRPSRIFSCRSRSWLPCSKCSVLTTFLLFLLILTENRMPCPPGALLTDLERRRRHAAFGQG